MLTIDEFVDQMRSRDIIVSMEPSSGNHEVIDKQFIVTTIKSELCSQLERHPDLVIALLMEPGSGAAEYLCHKDSKRRLEYEVEIKYIHKAGYQPGNRPSQEQR